MDAPPRPAGAHPRSLRTSVAAGIVLAVLAVGAVAAGPPVLFTVALVVILVAQAELYAVLRAAGRTPWVMFGLVCGALLLLAAYFGGLGWVAAAVCVPLPLLLLGSVAAREADRASVVTSTWFGLLYGPFLGAFAVLLLRGRNGPVLMAALLGVTAIFDSGGFLVGRKLGRHRMAPRTSPKKSWEGFAAGVAISVGLAVLVLPAVGPFSRWSAFRLATVLALAAPLGDLGESLIKRDLGVKDMGSLLPGHGGMFDRIDAILFNAPIAYLVVRVLHWAP
ncbi:MAG TPA: phosphatidate cytidylyltransferase [Actinomycetota bacterium]|nr:phosphatidate cytidylyltransferase [Actinomycetota bacterium]